MIKTAKNNTDTLNKMTSSHGVDTEIALLKKDVETIRDNHLVHLKEDVDRIENKVDKIDTRIWAILGVLVASVLGPLLANMLG